MSPKRFYNSVAERHRLFYIDWPATVQREGAWLHALFRPLGVRTVLDCTCGIGTQALGLALLGYEVTASDLSDANLAEAQQGAREFGVDVVWHRADVRRLAEAAMAGPFDAVISLGNSLSHLLTEQDLRAALRQMVDHATPGGVIVAGQRDWDTIRKQRPSGQFRVEHLATPVPGQRTILFDLWHYDEPLVTFEVFFLEGGDHSWNVEVHPLRYRMWQRRVLVDLMEEAGLTDIQQADHPWEVRLVGRRKE